MKNWTYKVLGVFAVALMLGFFIVQFTPAKNNLKFSGAAADQSLNSFDQLSRAKVSEVVDLDPDPENFVYTALKYFKATVLNGPEKDKSIIVEYDPKVSQSKNIKTGDIIIVGKIDIPNEPSYVLVDTYRLPQVLWMIFIFIALAVFFGKTRGFTSLIGLAFSVFILLSFIAPNILAGKSPELTTLVGAGIIALISIFLAHGFSQKTAIAIIGTFITLGFSEIISYSFVIWGNLSGGSSEEAFYLNQGFLGSINLRGLLLGGLIVGILGILNDVTTAQAATIEEIHNTNPELNFKELFKKGSSVGKEHIASLINTLVLVYAGASLPMFLLLTLNKTQPLWAVINSEFLAEEIIRTVIGGISLILAVPITTALAAYYFSSKK